MSQSKTIVVLGASLAGVPTAFKLLKEVAPRVPGLKVILVGPNTHYYWNVASVRSIIPDAMPDEKLFYPVEKVFSRYSASQFEFVLGKATKLDPDAKTVAVAPNAGGDERVISYDMVVVATGSSAAGDMPWKTVGDTETTKKALADLRARVKSASSIVVAGGGMTGVEVAAELGHAYKTSKKITLVIDGDLPFTDAYRKDIRANVVKELQRMGVKVLAGSRVAAVSEDGKTLDVLNKATGATEKVSTDLYLPAVGTVPNTQFVPAQLLDETKHVKTTKRLRAEKYDDVYVVGDACNIDPDKAAVVDPQVAYIVKDIAARLVSGSAPVPEYQPNAMVMFAVSLGAKRGAGQMGSFKLPSIAVRMAKSRNLMTERVPEFIRV